MSVVDEILWLLRDGKWHNLDEIGQNTALTRYKAEMALNFLEEYDFVHLNVKENRVRLQPSIHEFIKKIQHVEREEKLSH
jgi:DNA-binding IclR family transcriptional regulator